MDKISILIPTRNRPLLARLAIESALQNSDADSEVVVADNSDVPLELPQHARLRYLPPSGSPLGMPDNWERALEAASGEWLMLLSDKYMLVPNGLAALRREAARGCEVVTYAYGVLRQGLSAIEAGSLARLAEAGGQLQLPAWRPAELRASGAMLDAVCREPGSYASQAPMLYTALVARRLIERARSARDPFFFGPCPDVASALQILSQVEDYCATHKPVVMVQYPSPSAEWSTGASTLVGGDAGRRFVGLLGASGSAGALGLVSSLIFQTLLNAPAELRRRIARPASWGTYAREAAREIEGLPLGRRPGLHLSLLSFTQRPRPRLDAAWMQLRGAIGYHSPRLLVAAYGRVRQGDAPGDDAREFGGRLETRHVATRQAALGALSSVLA